MALLYSIEENGGPFRGLKSIAQHSKFIPYENNELFAVLFSMVSKRAYLLRSDRLFDIFDTKDFIFVACFPSLMMNLVVWGARKALSPHHIPIPVGNQYYLPVSIFDITSLPSCKHKPPGF